MTRLAAAGMALCVLAIGAGTIDDRPERRDPIVLDGWRVLAADFHMHSSTWSDGALTPWGLVLEAERQGLDAIAVTGHNEVLDGRVARWFAARDPARPLVLTGQEILAPGHHVIAVGIERRVDHTLPVARQIEAVHAQGGVAIAAHPIEGFWPGFDGDALVRLDGAEICHPLVFGSASNQRELEAFASRGRFAAIGSSDFHGFMRMGQCRTFVFARAATADAVLDALRAHRTVVYGLDDRAYGDPDLVRLAERDGRLKANAHAHAYPQPTRLARASQVFGLCGLIAIVVAIGRRRSFSRVL